MAQPAPAIESTPEPLNSVSATALRSPGLTLFRKNPFRLLRLSTRATEEEAVWKAQRILTQLRAGLELTEPDLLPWLPPGDELDVQEAAQKLEEPLRRLVEQLLWFDLAQAPQADVLARSLTTQDQAGLKGYLDLPVSQDDPGAAVALLINQANLSLALGFSLLHLGTRAPGSGMMAFERAAPPGEKKAPKLEWQQSHGLEVLEDAHRSPLTHALQANRELAWREVLADAFVEWVALLKDSRFHDYIQAQLRHIAEDLLADEHQESIDRAIKTLLADLLAGETKLLLAAGHMEGVSGLLTVAAKSGLDPQLLALSFRPLRHLFQAELSELENLVDESSANLQNVTVYLHRLEALLTRWRLIDTTGMLQLAEVGDEGVARAFNTLRQILEPGTDPKGYEQALGKASSLANSRYLQERIRAYAAQVQGYREHMICHFCGKREQNPEVSIVLTGQVLVRVEQIFNGTRRHYQLLPGFVPRCGTCADFHDLLNDCKVTSCLAGIALFLPMGLIFGNWSIAMAAGIFGGMILWVAVTWMLEGRAAAWIPKAYPNMAQTGAYRELRQQGFEIVRIDYARGAAASWKRTARASG
jgi:hypothetical protein